MSVIELLGEEQMLAAIRSKLSSGIAKLENQGLREGGEIFAEAQREKVAVSNVDHVHIRDDIQVSPVRRKNGIRFVAIGPGKLTAWRAHFLEYGTKKMPARPFIYPSFHENKARVLALFADLYREGMKAG